MNIILFDISDDFIKEATRLEKYGIRVIKSDVKDLVKNNKITALISPANSFGFMNGGIDKVYMDMFPNIQRTVQNKIEAIGLETNMGKCYLPIGSAITVNTNDSICPFLMVVPTMFLPCDIRGTNNIFYSFTAILFIAKNNLDYTIACPGLGTGVGMLLPKDAVDQMELAVNKVDRVIQNDNYVHLVKYCDKDNLILHKNPCE